MIWQNHCLLSQAHATTAHAQTCLTERVACQPPDDLVKWELFNEAQCFCKNMGKKLFLLKVETTKLFFPLGVKTHHGVKPRHEDTQG